MMVLLMIDVINGIPGSILESVAEQEWSNVPVETDFPIYMFSAAVVLYIPLHSHVCS